MANQEMLIEEYISELMARARKAQKLAERLTHNMCIARIDERDLRSDERRHFIEKIINDLR